MYHMYELFVSIYEMEFLQARMKLNGFINSGSTFWIGTYIPHSLKHNNINGLPYFLESRPFQQI